MLHKNFLDYFMIENAPGGNQDDLTEWDMNRGGCGAVTACDVCMFLAGKHERFRRLYPYDPHSISRDDFRNFAGIMKPYLSPRYHGIDFLETYICGFYDYMKSRSSNSLILEGLAGNVEYDVFEKAVTEQIDRGFPVPYLMLMHRDQALDDFNWHWFNLAGYEQTDSGLEVQTVTYGEFLRFGLRNMWDTGHRRKGGIVRIFERA
ncbi:MAG: hypothetical protein IJP54_06120 [Synergistaceae bacterium]|nr:hypothetical protein [Synergistaceae bacterium]MBR0035232.1 hypothetical protein [Synergistaceae bacterium]